MVNSNPHGAAALRDSKTLGSTFDQDAWSYLFANPLGGDASLPSVFPDLPDFYDSFPMLFFFSCVFAMLGSAAPDHADVCRTTRLRLSNCIPLDRVGLSSRPSGHDTLHRPSIGAAYSEHTV